MFFHGLRDMRTGIVMVLVLAFVPSVFAINASLRYRSPRNPERRVRPSTELIVLHTTEAPARSSLNKLSDRGEAHFCVTEDGGVYAIVDRDRVAFHAGRSMWNGKEDVDNFSIGIECVGYHDKPMPMAQLTAIRALVKDLKAMYRIPDERVVCHSHVAYGSPNKWQRRKHRGRKRCGMLFAMPSVRRVLDLKFRPAFDADTRAGRLVVGDDYLRGVLYGKTDTMLTTYAPPKAVAPPKPKAVAAAPKPKAVAPPKPKPVAPTPKPIIQNPKPAVAESKPTVRVDTSLPPKSIAQLMLRGYKQKGTVSKTISASKIAGSKWNASDTYYTIRGKVFPGNTMDAAHIEDGMCIWMKK